MSDKENISVTMNSWDTDKPGRDARFEATRAFCEYLDDPKNAAKRKECTLPQQPPGTLASASDAAKRLFADCGHFYVEGDAGIPTDTKAIPQKTVFRIYEFDPPANRDDLVTIVLPLGKTPQGTDFDAEDYYRCTYWPY
jgi:hypothetical protein